MLSKGPGRDGLEAQSRVEEADGLAARIGRAAPRLGHRHGARRRQCLLIGPGVPFEQHGWHAELLGDDPVLVPADGAGGA